MNSTDIREIQRELGIALPRSYVETVCPYPFPQDYWLEEILFGDAKSIIEINRDWRNTCWRTEHWKDFHFVIGHDGGECCYYIDLRLDDSPVYTISLEDGEFSLIEEATTLRDFVAQSLLDHEAALAEERQRQARRGSRSWWQFWK